MRRSLLFLAAGIMAGSVAEAQTPVIVNGSFETWTDVTAPLQITLERPNSWYGSDQTVNHTVGPLLILQQMDFDANKQLYKDVDRHDGDFAAKLMTKDFGDTLKVLPVLLTNARQNLDMGALMGGGLDDLDVMELFKFTEQTAMYGKRIDSVTAYVRTPGANVDPAGAFIIAYKKVNEDSMTVIGQGSVDIDPDTQGYVKISIPVTYMDGEATDSMVVGFVSSSMPGSGTSYHEDNTLFVDHVQIYASEVTSVANIRKVDLGFAVYPNPASAHINFENRGNENGTTLIIQNTVGQVMHYGKMNAGVTHIDLGKYAAGTYFYEIYNEKGNGRQTGKFVK